MKSQLETFIRRWLLRMINEARDEETRASNQLILQRMKTCGSGCGLWGPVHIRGLEEMEIGNNVHVGGGAFIRAEGGLTIGDNTHISRNLVLYTINHRREGGRIPYDEDFEKKPVVIGPNVWIGMNVCIAPGTVIEEGAVIGMGTTLSGKIPALSIVVGSKWRVVGSRNREHYDDCRRRMAFGGPDGVALSGERAHT